MNLIRIVAGIGVSGSSIGEFWQSIPLVDRFDPFNACRSVKLM